MTRAGRTGVGVGALSVWIWLAPAGAAAQSQLDLYSLPPCRAVDTRTIPENPLVDGRPREFLIKGTCGIPADARAVVVNVTAIAPNGQGFLTLYPAGWAAPVVSNLNFSAGITVGNGAAVRLAFPSVNGKDLVVRPRVAPSTPATGTVEMTLDVTGYFK